MYMQGMPPGQPLRPWIIQDTTGFDKGTLSNLFPGGQWPMGGVPGGAWPGELTPGGMMPGGMAPGGMMPGGMMPGGMTPSGMMPMESGGPWSRGLLPSNTWSADEVPEMEAPGMEAPEMETPETETPWMEAPGMEPGGMPGARPNERPFGQVLPFPIPPGPALPGRPGAGPGGIPMPGGAEPQGLIRRIEAYLQDEANAERLYRALTNQTEDATIKDYLTDAADDEAKHFRLLSQLYQRLTGRTYQVQAKVPQPGPLREELLKSITDELEAYTEYKTEYQRFSDPMIRAIFFELFSDEIEHAVRFNTALHILMGER